METQFDFDTQVDTKLKINHSDIPILYSSGKG